MMSLEQNEGIDREITRLENEIATLADDIAECSRRADELLWREAEGEGPFAAEIFLAKREKLRLKTELQIRKVRLNKIRLGFLPEGGD